MKRTATALVLLVSLLNAQEPNPEPIKQAVLIVLDGTEREVLKALIKEEKVPNLAAIAKEGSMQDIDVKDHKSVTFPGLTQITTGVDDEVSGVTDNKVNGKMPHVPKGMTVFERLEKIYGDSEITTIMFDTVVDADSAKRMRADNLFSQNKFDKEIIIMEDDFGKELSNLAAAIDTSKRFLLMFYFNEPDHTGHVPAKLEEYKKVLIRMDQHVGELRKWISDTLKAKPMIYATTDHGFEVDGEKLKGHKNAPNSWLITNDPAVKSAGIQADITPTILARFGVDLSKLDEPKLMGSPLLKSRK